MTDTSENQIEGNLTDQLREAIQLGQYMPSERLVEAEVAKRYSTNRSNVRIALAVLEQEGLVIREVNRGARVRMVSEREAIEIAEARMALEARVAYRAAELATAQDCDILHGIISEMRTVFDAGDYLEFSELNAKLHRELQRIAANGTINGILGGLKSRTVRIQFKAILLPGRAEQSMAEHRAIVEAICRHDPEAAEAVMRMHMSSVVSALKKAIEINRFGGL